MKARENEQLNFCQKYAIGAYLTMDFRNKGYKEFSCKERSMYKEKQMQAKDYMEEKNGKILYTKDE